MQKTILRTFSEEEPDGTELVIEWEKYEKIDEALESVKHDLFRIPKKVIDPISGKAKKVKKGTQLILFGLKDIWNSDYLNQLKNELTLLVSPFAGINDFSIYLFIDLTFNFSLPHSRAKPDHSKTPLIRSM